MKMNKKAQEIFVFLMVGIIILIMGILFIGPLKNETINAGNSTALNCSNPDISNVDVATCTVLDMGFFYFISVVIATGLALIAGKRTITGVLTSIMVFVVTIALISPLKDLIILARDSTHLNCVSGNITVGAKLTCIFVDLWLFYFIVIAIAAAINLIFIKRVLPRFQEEE